MKRKDELGPSRPTHLKLYRRLWGVSSSDMVYALRARVVRLLCPAVYSIQRLRLMYELRLASI